MKNFILLLIASIVISLVVVTIATFKVKADQDSIPTSYVSAGEKGYFVEASSTIQTPHYTDADFDKKTYWLNFLFLNKNDLRYDLIYERGSADAINVVIEPRETDKRLTASNISSAIFVAHLVECKSKSEKGKRFVARDTANYEKIGSMLTPERLIEEMSDLESLDCMYRTESSKLLNEIKSTNNGVVRATGPTTFEYTWKISFESQILIFWKVFISILTILSLFVAIFGINLNSFLNRS